MALTEDQKKYLVLGTVGGAFALFVGSMIFGDRKAVADPMIGPPGTRSEAPGHHGRQRAKRRHDDGGDSRDYEYSREQDDGQENGRGEYGRKKHHHKGHRHEH